MADTLEPAAEGPIILRKKVRLPEEPHGGAWKVAYADFVTAMMAFFLLLWLLNVTTEDAKQGISDFFEPVGISQEETGSGSVLKGLAMDAQGALRSSGSPPRVTVAIPTFGTKESGDSEGDNDAPETVGGGYTDGIDRNAADDIEEQQFKRVIAALRQAVQEIPEFAQMQDNLLLEPTPDGLMIQILDRVKLRMFDSNSAEFTDRGRHLVAIIASITEKLPNRITVTGHTDKWAAPLPEADRKWEISGKRAERARRTLIGFGVEKDRFFRVAGKADNDPLHSSAPVSDRNNRISILLLRQDHPDLADATGGVGPKG